MRTSRNRKSEKDNKKNTGLRCLTSEGKSNIYYIYITFFDAVKHKRSRLRVGDIIDIGIFIQHRAFFFLIYFSKETNRKKKKKTIPCTSLFSGDLKTLNKMIFTAQYLVIRARQKVHLGQKSRDGTALACCETAR